MTALSIAVTLFRQSYLQKGFAADMLCTVLAVMVYELAVFLIGVFLGMTLWARMGTHLLTGVYSLVFAPLLHPVVQWISSINATQEG